MNFLPIIRKFFKFIAYGALTLIGLVFLFFSFFPESLESNLKQYNLDQFLSNTGDKINTFSNEITFIKPSPETLKAVNSKGIYINYPQKSMRFSLEEMGLSFNEKKDIQINREKLNLFKNKLVSDLNYLAKSPVISLESSEFYQLGEGASLEVNESEFLSKLSFGNFLNENEPRISIKFNEKFDSQTNISSNLNLVNKITEKPIQLKAGRTEINVSGETLKTFIKSRNENDKQIMYFDYSTVTQYLSDQNRLLNFASEIDLNMSSAKLSNHLLFRLTEENPSRTFILPIKGSFTLSPMLHPKFIEVNKSQQRAYLFENGNLVKTYIISTGVTWETPTGTFKVLNKVPMTISYSGYWYMPWYLPIGTINGPYYFGFHEVPYHMDYKGMIYSRDPETIGSPATGGCIQLLKGQAKELFDWAETGMPVYITE